MVIATPSRWSDQDPNYAYRVFNDSVGRVARAEEGGYEVVRTNQELGDATVDSATAVGSAVTRPVGGGMTGVLMRIPREVLRRRPEGQAD